MGMFDSLIVPCLFCKQQIEVQTKSGPCFLDEYKWDDPNLPLWLMEGLNNEEVECYKCNRPFKIIFDYQVIFKGRRLEPIDNLDMLELKVKEQEDEL